MPISHFAVGSGQNLSQSDGCGKDNVSVADSATRLWPTGVDFILLNIVVGWPLSTNARPAENIFLLFSSGPRGQGK